MTLVEVMISLVVFSVAILGTVGVFLFALRTVEDSRSFTQVTQILNHEMEAMRMREWNDRPPFGTSPAIKGLFTLGGAPASFPFTAESEFTPYAVYGAPLRTDGISPAVLGGSDPNDVSFGNNLLQAQYRNAGGNAAGFVCKRIITLKADGCGEKYAEVTLKVTWVDKRGLTHSRSMHSTMAENGLNKRLYDPANI